MHTASPTREPPTGPRGSERASSSPTRAGSVRLLLARGTRWFQIDQRSHLPGAGSHSSRVPSGRGGRFSPTTSCTRSLSSSVYRPATRLFCLDDDHLLLTLGHSWATQQSPPTILSEVLRQPAFSIETEPMGVCVCVCVCVCV